MKKILYSIAITIFLTANLHAQQVPGKWGIVPNPAGLVQGFSDMVFVNDTAGYIYGALSPATNDMQHTIDSGVDFSVLPIQTTLHTPTFGSHMAWPTAQNGCIIADTGIFPNPTAVFSIHTSNGGTSWTTSKIDSSLQIQNLYFPSANVGYGTGTLADGSADFVAKTTDGGNTWSKIYNTTDYAFGNTGKLYFINDNNGMFFAQNNANLLLILYTTNGGASFKPVPLQTNSSPNFLHWSKDSSWLVGADSVYRSIDSGKTWTCVVPCDSSEGAATVGAFYGDTGFVFTGIQPNVFMTTDFGVTWAKSRLPNNGPVSDSVTPLAASMASPHACYLLAADNFQTSDVLLKIAFAKPADTTGGGGGDAVQENPTVATPFAAMFGNNAITFTMAPAPEARSIQILDVLGRNCKYISLPSYATNSQMANSELHSGTYFARLGGSVVKFAIP